MELVCQYFDRPMRLKVRIGVAGVARGAANAGVDVQVVHMQRRIIDGCGEIVGTDSVAHVAQDALSTTKEWDM